MVCIDWEWLAAIGWRGWVRITRRSWNRCSPRGLLGAALAPVNHRVEAGQIRSLLQDAEPTVSGLGIGIAQRPLLRDRMRASAVWVPAIAGLWALGWTVSTAIGVDLTTQRWAVFGASGAVSVAVLSGVLLWSLRQGSSIEQKAVLA